MSVPYANGLVPIENIFAGTDYLLIVEVGRDFMLSFSKVP